MPSLERIHTIANKLLDLIRLPYENVTGARAYLSHRDFEALLQELCPLLTELEFERMDDRPNWLSVIIGGVLVTIRLHARFFNGTQERVPSWVPIDEVRYLKGVMEVNGYKLPDSVPPAPVPHAEQAGSHPNILEQPPITISEPRVPPSSYAKAVKSNIALLTAPTPKNPSAKPIAMLKTQPSITKMATPGRPSTVNQIVRSKDTSQPARESAGSTVLTKKRLGLTSSDSPLAASASPPTRAAVSSKIGIPSIPMPQYSLSGGPRTRSGAHKHLPTASLPQCPAAEIRSTLACQDRRSPELEDIQLKYPEEPVVPEMKLQSSVPSPPKPSVPVVTRALVAERVPPVTSPSMHVSGGLPGIRVSPIDLLVTQIWKARKSGSMKRAADGARTQSSPSKKPRTQSPPSKTAPIETFMPMDVERPPQASDTVEDDVDQLEATPKQPPAAKGKNLGKVRVKDPLRKPSLPPAEFDESGYLQRVRERLQRLSFLGEQRSQLNQQLVSLDSEIDHERLMLWNQCYDPRVLLQSINNSEDLQVTPEDLEAMASTLGWKLVTTRDDARLLLLAARDKAENQDAFTVSFTNNNYSDRHSPVASPSGTSHED